MHLVNQIVPFVLFLVLGFGVILIWVLFDILDFRALPKRLKEERERDTGGESSKD